MLVSAPMHYAAELFALFFGLIGDTLDILLFVLGLRRKLYRSLICFFAYIMFLVPRDFIWLWISHTTLFGTIPAFYFYWTTESILSILRLATIIEIARRALRDYPSVWALAWRFLAAIGAILFFWTADAALRHSHHLKFLITIGLQRFELMQATLLLSVLMIGVYYRIQIRPSYRWILVGICIFSAVQVANYELGRLTVHATNSVFDYLRRYSFLASQTIWMWALWRWAAVPHQPPELVSQALYDEHSERAHDRLRALNDRLAGLLHQ
jgi:hypothetical protein